MKNVISQSLGLELVNINVYAKVYRTIPLSSRDRAISLFQNLNLGNASANPKWHLTALWATSCQYQCICKILSTYSKRFKTHRHFSRTCRGQNLYKQSKDKIFTKSPRTKSSQTVRWQNQMFDYRALYEIQLQVSVDFLRVVQLLHLYASLKEIISHRD